MVDQRSTLRGSRFLQAERPEAMQHLLAFYREAGKHLDEKTRHLVSVITKVINFSPRGLRQYARHAIDAGATRDELLDVILLAYPCAGLTRVNDAVDVLLDAGLLDVQSVAKQQWHRVELDHPLFEGEIRPIDVAGQDVVLVRNLGRVYALRNRCAHQGGKLSDGHLNGDQIVCPLHGWCFRLGDGTRAETGESGVDVFAVRGDGTCIEVRL